MNTLYNTYIIRIDDFKAVKLQGNALDSNATNHCVKSAERRLKMEDYFITSYELGSARDLECQADMKSEVDDRLLFN